MFKKLYLFLTLLTAFLWLGSGTMWGDELTVSDATSTKEQSPIYGYYADEVALHNQVLYPASVFSTMSAMNGKNITKLTFYSSTANSSWGDPEFEVGLVEVTASSLSGLNSTTPNNVFSGVLKVISNQLVIEFEEPYEYKGGNLLIDINCTKKRKLSTRVFLWSNFL